MNNKDENGYLNIILLSIALIVLAIVIFIVINI